MATTPGARLTARLSFLAVIETVFGLGGGADVLACGEPDSVSAWGFRLMPRVVIAPTPSISRTSPVGVYGALENFVANG